MYDYIDSSKVSNGAKKHGNLIRKTILISPEEYDKFKEFHRSAIVDGYFGSESLSLRYLIRVGLDKQNLINVSKHDSDVVNDDDDFDDDDVDFPE